MDAPYDEVSFINTKSIYNLFIKMKNIIIKIKFQI